MPTAVETTPQSKAATPAVGLFPASLLGAAFLLFSCFIVGYGIPRLIGSLPKIGGFGSEALQYVVQIAAIVALIVLVFRVVGPNAPKGFRGGVFLTLVCATVTFFIARAVGMAMEGNGFVGQLIAVAVLAGLVFGSYKLLTGGRGTRWMLALEHQGWFHTFSYKRSQGQKVRKWTMIGVMIVGFSGVYAIWHQSLLPAGDWTPRIPFTDVKIPFLLVVLTLWIGWRTVNVPPFADFLIATEAEMNKVSWTPIRKLMRDTVVVLVFTALLTGFLLSVDIFWGWTLSNHYVGILPPKPDPTKNNPNGENIDW
jgi:preprotein translocase SecE subunit